MTRWATTSTRRAPIEPLHAFSKPRADGLLNDSHAGRPSTFLADLPHNKRWRSAQICAVRGHRHAGAVWPRLVRGAGLGLIPNYYLTSRDIIDKCGKGFHAGSRNVVADDRYTTLLLGGITTDVCVHTTMREGNDRGFDAV